MKTETKPKPKVPKIPAAPESRAPALAVEAWPVDRPKPYAKNPRRNDAAVEKVAASIREFGWAQPIVVDGDGVIIIGHTRLKAAKKLGLATVPVLVRADLSPEQVAALRLADNKTAELAEWDEPLLAAELDALVGAVDMEQFGFDLSAPELTEGQTDEDAVPEPPPEPVSRRGAVYALGRHRLMCGDSTSAEDVAKLMHGESARMVFTDPPWNVAYGEQKNHPTWKARTILNDKMSTDAFHSFMDGFFGCMSSSCEKGAPTYVVMSAQEWGNLMLSLADAGYHWSSTIIWAKDRLVLSRKDYHTQYEPIWYGWLDGAPRLCEVEDRKQSDLWEIPRPSRSEEHPTMKPVELVARAIGNSSRGGDVVLDLFGGSGTTLVAAEKTGRSCRMMELDPKYCDVIRKRWAEFVHGEGCDWQTIAPEVEE